MSKLINGIAASDGVAIAKAYLIVEPDLSLIAVKQLLMSKVKLANSITLSKHLKLN